MSKVQQTQSPSSLLWEPVGVGSGYFTRCEPLDKVYEQSSIEGNDDSVSSGNSAVAPNPTPLSNTQLETLANLHPPAESWFEADMDKPF